MIAITTESNNLFDYELLPEEKKKMDVPLAVRWIKALREPGRKQTRHVLQRRRKDGTVAQCCLGVICEIAGLNSEPATNFDTHTAGQHFKDLDVYLEGGEKNMHNRFVSMPPWTLMQKLGIDRMGNVFTHMNDKSKTPFKLIADRYEKWLIREGVLDGPVA